MPPATMIFIGYGDFVLMGKIVFEYFFKLCESKPYEKILDVGCDIGRMVVPSIVKRLEIDYRS